jgi:NAD-dependent deacetylase sirtuin 1
MALGVDPRRVLKEMVEEEMEIPPEMDSRQIWNAIISMLMEPKPRSKLPHINTLEDVVHLLRTCKNIVVLTGAGVGFHSVV